MNVSIQLGASGSGLTFVVVSPGRGLWAWNDTSKIGILVARQAFWTRRRLGAPLGLLLAFFLLGPLAGTLLLTHLRFRHQVSDHVAGSPLSAENDRVSANLASGRSGPTSLNATSR
ncbi:MAG TPA: hypothetical protein VM818_08105 [Vicinamibacterales bacterium]|nr:hypothetical protein [Vicinamibacterales bacterium]